MVLIIKGSTKRETAYLGRNSFPTILIRLAKLMINVQYARKIFEWDGSFVDKSDDFLVYRDEKNDLTYTIQPGNAFIQFTGMPFGIESIEQIKPILMQIFEAIAVEHPALLAGEKLIPFSYGSFHPTTHFTALFEKMINHWENSIILNPTEAGLARASNIEFLWAIYDQTRDMKYWVVSENVRGETQIFRDLVTIIVDFGALNIPEGIHFEPITEGNVLGFSSVIRTNLIMDKRYGIQPTLAGLYLMPAISNSVPRILKPSKEIQNLPDIYDCPDFEKLPLMEKIYMWRQRPVFIFREYIKLILSAEVKTDETAFVPTPEQQSIEDYGGCLDSKRRDICIGCYVPLYGDIYVLQSVQTKKCIGFCPMCFESIFNNVKNLLKWICPCIAWKTVYPRSILKVIDDKDIKIAMKAYQEIDHVKLPEMLKFITTATKRIYNDLDDQFEFSGTSADKPYKIIVVNISIFTIQHYKLAHDEKAYVINGGIMA